MLPNQSEFPLSPHELNPNQSATYEEVIDYYSKMATASKYVELKTYGKTDSGKPIHLAIVSKSGEFDPVKLRNQGKRILMINNGIHPGEPVGIDATILLLKDYLQDESLMNRLDEIVLVIIPVYNIGGALNRSSTSRANQIGPDAYGFRGNARNLDLNRDFIKCDSRNSRIFSQIFQEWEPDVFLDNHTSNGADYPYVMTLIPTQHNKLDPALSRYMNNKMLPYLYEQMKENKWEMSPYVYARDTPDKGIAGFLDLPRYSSGYTALFNTIGLITEAHMLKDYKDRVESNYVFMDLLIKVIERDARDIADARAEANINQARQKRFPIHWEMDESRVDSLLFKGYKAAYKPSEVHGMDRLYYDQTKPYEKEIPFFNTYKADLHIEKPYAYIIPQAWEEVIERLRLNGIKMQALKQDQIVDVEVYYIREFETSKTPYEGHYLHSKVQVAKKMQSIQYYVGDIVIFPGQWRNRYIIETLEPQAHDSFFAWNFFDAILQQKEYFSPYVFEDTAAELLKNDPELREKLADKKARDPEFSKSSYAQLMFVYKNSPYYEKTHQRYPVSRVLTSTNLSI